MALSQEQINRIRGKLNISDAVEPSASVAVKPRSALERLAERAQTPSVAPTVEATTEAPITTSTPAPTTKPDIIGDLGGQGREGIKDVKEAFQRSARGEQSPLETSAQVVGEGVQFGGDLLAAGARGALDLFVKGRTFIDPQRRSEEEIRSEISEPFRKMAESKTGQLGLEALSKGFDAYDAWKSKNKRAAANIEAAISFVDLATLGKLTTGKQIFKSEVKTVAKKIQPKLTRKEISRALDEGRVIRTSAVRKFFGKADQVKIN